MVIFGYCVIHTTFRYNLSGFSGEWQEKFQIGDSCGHSKFFTATGGWPPLPFKDIFSTPRGDSVPDPVSVYATNYSKQLLNVVVNNSTGGSGGSFGICLSVLDAPKTYATIGMFTSSSWELRFRLTAVLYEFMVRYLKLQRCVLRLIVSFYAVGASVKRPFLSKSWFFF